MPSHECQYQLVEKKKRTDLLGADETVSHHLELSWSSRRGWLSRISNGHSRGKKGEKVVAGGHRHASRRYLEQEGKEGGYEGGEGDLYDVGARGIDGYYSGKSSKGDEVPM